jgi:hypothetical protein
MVSRARAQERREEIGGRVTTEVKANARPPLPKKVLVLIDYSNWHYALRARGWEVDWLRFREYCVSAFGRCRFYFYDGTPSLRHYLEANPDRTSADFASTVVAGKKRFFLRLRDELRFVVRTKPVHRVYDHTTGLIRTKCNFDVEITIDALENLPEYGTLVLCSGDGDFVPLLKYFKGRFRR